MREAEVEVEDVKSPQAKPEFQESPISFGGGAAASSQQSGEPPPPVNSPGQDPWASPEEETAVTDFPPAPAPQQDDVPRRNNRN